MNPKSHSLFLVGLAVGFLAIGSASARPVTKQANSGSSQSIPLGQSQVSGHVYRGDTGAPLSGAVVTLYDRASPVEIETLASRQPQRIPMASSPFPLSLREPVTVLVRSVRALSSKPTPEMEPLRAAFSSWVQNKK